MTPITNGYNEFDRVPMPITEEVGLAATSNPPLLVPFGDYVEHRSNSGSPATNSSSSISWSPTPSPTFGRKHSLMLASRLRRCYRPIALIVVTLNLLILTIIPRMPMMESCRQHKPISSTIDFESYGHIRSFALNLNRSWFRRTSLPVEKSSIDFSSWWRPASDQHHQEEHTSNEENNVRIVAITPTNSQRLEQKADMTRLAQTLRLITRFHWIVVEDAIKPSQRISRLLERSMVSHTHLAVAGELKKGTRGMAQRNAALDWIEKQLVADKDAIQHQHRIHTIVYFADDDNTYDSRLFDEYIRKVKRVGVWPVGRRI